MNEIEEIRGRLKGFEPKCGYERQGMGFHNRYGKDVETLLAHIDKLEPENARLREALTRIAPLDITLDAPVGDEERLKQACQIATAALKGESDA